MKNRNLFLFLFCLNASLTSFAQTTLPKPVSDSLWAAWSDESVPDTLRIESMRKYIWDGYLYSKPDSALFFADILYSFAKIREIKKGVALALFAKGIAFHEKVNYDQALVHYQQSLKISEEINDKSGIAAALNDLGITYEDKGDYSNALLYYQQCLVIQKEIEDKKGIALTYNNIGVIYKNQGDFSQALIYYKRSLKISEEIEDRKGISTMFNNIGIIYKRQSDFNQALSYFQQSLKIKEEIRDKKGIVNSLNGIGNIYLEKGEYTLALTYYQKSLKIAEDIKYRKGISANLGNIGIIYKNQGDYAAALNNYLQSLKIREEDGFKEGIAYSLNNMGVLYKIQGDYTQALNYSKQSLKIQEEIGNKSGILTSLNTIGTIYLNQGDYTEALAYFQQNLKIAEEIGAKLEIPLALSNIGATYHYSKDFDLSINYFLQAYVLSKEIGAKTIWLNSTLGLYSKYVITDTLSKAETHLKELVDLRREDLRVNYPGLSEQEKEKYFSTMAEDFALQYDFAITHPDFPDNATRALNNALLLKGLNLKSSVALRQNILTSGDSLLIADYETWMALKRKASKAYAEGKDFAEFEKQADDVEKKLAKNSNAFASMEKAQNITGQEVVLKLNKSEAAIEFVRFKHIPDFKKSSIHVPLYAAFVMLPEKEPIMIRLFEEPQLAKLLQVKDGNPAAQIEYAYGNKDNINAELYKVIWKPLEAYLQGVNRIYFAADGLLHKLSFAAIRSESGEYLSAKYNLHQLSSTAQLTEVPSPGFSSNETVLLAGGINYGAGGSKGEVWKYLTGTLTETERISHTLKKQKVQTLTGNNATEEALKREAEKVGILHIATHGFFYPDPEELNEELKMKSEQLKQNNSLTFRGSTNYAYWSFVLNKNPLMRSGLILANANNVWDREALQEGEDGILTAAEIANLNLSKSKLVVLSACETGLGEIKGSEGVFGLQRAFKMAGAQKLMMSLWQVPDKETSEFMELFYKKLLKENDPRKAFIQTQKTMREKYDPYYWAAFVLLE